MENVGNILGLLTGFGFFLAILNYPVKWINKRWISKMPNESLLKKRYMTFMKFIIKYHRFFAIGATIALITHFAIQLNFKWISTIGLIAAAFLISNALLGAYGFYIQKRKRGTWLKAHHFISVVLLIAIIIHVSQ